MKLFGAQQCRSPGRDQSLGMIDALEPRSLFSASLHTNSSAGEAYAIAQFQTQALKASVTAIKVYSNTSTVGAAVTIAAAVAGKTSSGIPTGTVTFMAGTTVLGTVTLRSDGSARISTTALPIGTSLITAVYSGSSRFSASTSVQRGHLVLGGSTTAKLSVSAASLNFGDEVSFVAHVGNVAHPETIPTGRAVFYDGSTVIGSHTLNSVGAARLTTRYLYVGSHPIEAVYFGSNMLAAHRSSIHTVTVATPTVTTQSDGLAVGTILAGSGVSAATGDAMAVNYTLYLASTGKKLESSYDSGQPLTFTLGESDLLVGFNEGLVGARQGERRVLVIPPSLGYGSTGSTNVPPNATIVFVIDVLAIQQHA